MNDAAWSERFDEGVSQLVVSAGRRSGGQVTGNANAPMPAVLGEALVKLGDHAAESVLQLAAEMDVRQQRLNAKGAELAQLIRNSTADYAEEVREFADRQEALGIALSQLMVNLDRRSAA